MSTQHVLDDAPAVLVSSRGVRFHEMECALPLETFHEAMSGVRDILTTLSSAGQYLSFPLEVRTCSGDDAWLSPAHRRDTLYIAVHRYIAEDPEAVFAPLEELFRSLGGRPHWGKIHTFTAAEARGSYPRFDEFLRLRAQLDPRGVFTNAGVQRLLS